MADCTVKVLAPAASYALLTLAELKAAYGITTSTTTLDTQLQMLIDQYSDVIATLCNRVFAKEMVEEKWRGFPPPYDYARVFLTHYPVEDSDVASVYAPGGAVLDAQNYELENRTGKLSLVNPSPSMGAAAPGEFIVTYTGGYDLPEKAPPALKQAAILLIQGARSQLARGVNTNVRSIVHKESRVQFFDPAGGSGSKAGHTPLTAAGESVTSLLYHYIRVEA